MNNRLPNNEHDWLYTVYEGVKELVPNDAPAPLGKEVVTTTYFDANLYANLITGRAMTGIIHLLNKTPLESYSKAQSVVAAATFGSEFIAARLSMEQIYAIRTELRYLGVPVSQRSYAFGDNLSVITQATVPSSTLSKRHFALSYHAVREAIAGGWLSIRGAPMDPHDIKSYGMEWQVKHSLGDAQVFSVSEGPQWPKQECLMPEWSKEDEKKKSNLRSNKRDIVGAARLACAGVVDYDLCVEDVTVSGEIGLAKSFGRKK